MTGRRTNFASVRWVLKKQAGLGHGNLVAATIDMRPSALALQVKAQILAIGGLGLCSGTWHVPRHGLLWAVQLHQRTRQIADRTDKGAFLLIQFSLFYEEEPEPALPCWGAPQGFPIHRFAASRLIQTQGRVAPAARSPARWQVAPTPKPARLLAHTRSLPSACHVPVHMGPSA